MTRDQCTMNNVVRLSLQGEIYLEVQRLTLFCMTHPGEEEQPQKILRSRQLYGLLVLLVHLVSWITKYQKKEYNTDK